MDMMLQHHLLLQTGLLLSFVIFSYNLTPNIGDVRLFNVKSNNGFYNGEAQMYLTDGSSQAEWSSICKSNSFDIDEAMIFCKQLGYAYEKILAVGIRPSMGPFLISNINCKKGKKYKNLLECNYNLKRQNCNDGVFLECKDNDVSSIEGHLELCPPDPTEPLNSILSVSFGVIGIYLRNHWRAIGNSTISQGARNIANLMCISLGFQTAVLGSPRKAESFEQYTFSSCQKKAQSYSWINMTDIEKNCNVEKQYPCLGCCLKYPSKPSCGDSPLCANDFMVIQCTFNLFEKTSKITYQENCTFSGNSLEGVRIPNYSSVCNSKDQNNVEIAFIVLFFISLVIIIIFVAVNSYCCYKKYKHHNDIQYRPQEQDNHDDQVRQPHD